MSPTWRPGRAHPSQVLSVNKALSIQSHPDKALAEKLHSERPKVWGVTWAGAQRSVGGGVGTAC
eukprot:364051-Chlamydomonas_euryale.AAC.13